MGFAFLFFLAFCVVFLSYFDCLRELCLVPNVVYFSVLSWLLIVPRVLSNAYKISTLSLLNRSSEIYYMPPKVTIYTGWSTKMPPMTLKSFGQRCDSKKALTRKPEDLGKITDLSQVIDKIYHIMLYTSPWSRFELTTSVVIGTDDISSCKSNYHTITAKTVPFVLLTILRVAYRCTCNAMGHIWITLWKDCSNLGPKRGG